MIANALRVEIEQYAARIKTSNPLFRSAENGTMTPERIGRYLASVHFLVSHTPIHLGRARDGARARGDTPLAEHYRHKIGEEQGHDLWAERDLRRVSEMAPSVPTGVASTPDVARSMRRLAAWLPSVIDEEPSLYLAYILFAEYLTVLMGPEWLRLLEERCGIPRTSMTVIGNHAELDREHCEEAFEHIDRLVADPRRLPRMREVLRQSIVMFERFCAEIVESEQVHGDVHGGRSDLHAAAS